MIPWLGSDGSSSGAKLLSRAPEIAERGYKQLELTYQYGRVMPFMGKYVVISAMVFMTTQTTSIMER